MIVLVDPRPVVDRVAELVIDAEELPTGIAATTAALEDVTMLDV